MTRVHVAASRYAREGAGGSVSTLVAVGEHEFPVAVTSASRRIRPLLNPGDAWVPIALIPAMRKNLPLVMDDPVSPELVASLPTIQATFTEWYPDLSICGCSWCVSTGIHWA